MKNGGHYKVLVWLEKLLENIYKQTLKWAVVHVGSSAWHNTS